VGLAGEYCGLHVQLQHRIELAIVVVVLVVVIERSMFEARSGWNLSDDGCESRRRRRSVPSWAREKGVTEGGGTRSRAVREL